MLSGRLYAQCLEAKRASTENERGSAGEAEGGRDEDRTDRPAPTGLLTTAVILISNLRPGTTRPR